MQSPVEAHKLRLYSLRRDGATEARYRETVFGGFGDRQLMGVSSDLLCGSSRPGAVALRSDFDCIQLVPSGTALSGFVGTGKPVALP